VDLAVAIAVVSSYRDRPLERDAIFLGEVGLNGFIRPVSHLATRIKEAEKLGFTEIMLPETGQDLPAVGPGVSLVKVKHLNDAIAASLGRPAPRQG